MPPDKSERELLGEIIQKLDKVVGLLAIQGKDQDSQLHILRSFGFDYPAIGMMVGMKPDAVRMRLNRKRHK